MIRAGSIVHNLDWFTIGLCFVLMLLGWTAIFSAGYHDSTHAFYDFGTESGKQLFWIGICMMLCLVILNVEGSMFNQFAWPMYGFVLLLLLLVLLVGKEVGGAKAWFRIGGFGIQPSEFSKMAIALVMARFIAESGSKFRHVKTRLKAAGILLFPAGLILLQPDLGTVLVYSSFVFVLYREGLSGAILIGGMGGIALGVICIIMGQGTIDYPLFGPGGGEHLLYVLVVIAMGIGLLLVKLFTFPRFRKKRAWSTVLWGVAALIFSIGVSTVMKTDLLLKGYQKQRILITLGQVEDPQGSGYNLDKSKMAIGSGGFSGKGYLHGPMTKYNYVPEQSTDFIFTIIGEEWGFLGCFVVLVLQITLCLRLLFLAERQRSQFSRVYGYSCASILFMHLLINVGMVIGLAPVIGIPLPFFSYGGSSILGFTILISIMLRLDAERLTIFR